MDQKGRGEDRNVRHPASRINSTKHIILRLRLGYISSQHHLVVMKWQGQWHEAEAQQHNPISLGQTDVAASLGHWGNI